jgi:hypothetical protein
MIKNSLNNQSNKDKNERTDIKHPIKFPYLKKGGGKLASQFHGETKFAQQRKLKIIREQEERERDFDNDSY